MYTPDFEEFRRRAKRGNLVPVYREVLADLETPVSAFLKIDRPGGRSFLLESVEGGEKIGRYSFLGTAPSLLFRSKGRRVEIIRGKAVTTLEADNPLKELRRLLGSFRFVPAEGLPRFCGGFVGYLGYDMVRFFERLPDDTLDDLNLPDSVLFFTDTLLVFDHVRHRIQVVSNAHIEGPDEVALRAAYDDAISKIDTIVDMLHQPLTPPAQRTTPSAGGIEVESNTSRQQFEEAVGLAKEYVCAGDVVQVVLSQRFRTKLSADPINVYRALRSLNPSPFMYYIKCDECRIIGSSPEVFVRCEDGDVELRPIAGTRRRGDTPEEDAALAEELLADEKERAEHVMLVDLGRNDVGRVCRYGTVRVADFMVIERYSHVMHIVSDVVGRLQDGKDSFDVVEASFPAGTLSGAPKVRAMEIIEELEPTKRGPYGGAIGYFSFSGNLDTCITIRTLVLVGDDAYVQAGAGIVADSVPECEYEETCNKARAVLAAIERAEAGLD